MHRIMASIVLGCVAIISPGVAHAQDMGQMLQGLTTGNPQHDQAVHEAYQRGYRRGYQDAQRRERRGPDYQEDRPDYAPPPPPPR